MSGEEKRRVFDGPSPRQIVDMILERIGRATSGEELFSKEEASLVSRYFLAQIRHDPTLDTEANRQQLSLIKQDSSLNRALPLIDPAKPSPVDENNARFDTERRIREIHAFFQDLETLATDSTVSQDDKAFIFLALDKTRNLYQENLDQNA